ncbi:leucine-rich repeat-containing protein 74B-like [Bacillus rossius redtenbacheri]|uniref:leucine-rich repeat-containing protein 74B-like n=1 Tax=Bacillus rossius redtenbacheri TaxID=93214 RepID=UPI002FDD0D92
MDLLYKTLDESLKEIEANDDSSTETDVIAGAESNGESLGELVKLETLIKQLILEPVFDVVLPDVQNPRLLHPDTSFIDPTFIEIHEEIDDYKLPELSQDVYKDFSFKSFIDVPEEPDRLKVGSYLEMCRMLDTPPISKVINSLEKETMNLNHHRVDTNAMRAIMEVLSSNPSVKRLDLSHVVLEPRAAYFLGEILLSNNNIEELNLSWSRLGPEGLEQLKTGLIESCVGKLDLSHNSIGDEGVQHLADYLYEESYLRSLILKHNVMMNAGLGEASAKLLAESLSDSRLEELDLSWNNLSRGEGAQALLGSLAGNGRLSSLDLSWTGLGGEAAGLALQNMLQSNKVMRHLDLSNNVLSSEEAKMMGDGLGGNATLETLNVGHNRFTLADCKTLLKAVPASAVRTLDLGSTWVDKEFLQMLDKVWEDRQVTVRFGKVAGDYVIHGPDLKRLHLVSAKFEAQAPKAVRKRRDFGQFLFHLGDSPMPKENFVKMVKKEKIKLDSSLVQALATVFADESGVNVEVLAMRELYLQMYPETMPPAPKKRAKKKKGAKKKKKKTAGDASEKKAPKKKKK